MGPTKRRPRVTDTVVYVTYKVTEPLLLSPFTFGNQDGKQGFYGIQTMNFQMNIAAKASRAWRSVNFMTNEVAFWGDPDAFPQLHLQQPHQPSTTKKPRCSPSRTLNSSSPS
jgi:hypothetical protein